MSADVIVGNNIFTNNDFNATAFYPQFFPTTLFVDGGGNIFGSQITGGK